MLGSDLTGDARPYELRPDQKVRQNNRIFVLRTHTRISETGRHMLHRLSVTSVVTSHHTIKCPRGRSSSLRLPSPLICRPGDMPSRRCHRQCSIGKRLLHAGSRAVRGRGGGPGGRSRDPEFPVPRSRSGLHRRRVAGEARASLVDAIFV